jgi:serine/threonine-protein kinase
MLTSGTRLGPYEIVATLGSGGMGEVYRARDTRLGRDVAVKVLPPAVAADVGRRLRFEREARVVAAISHPHICALYDVGAADGHAFFVMELLDGESLAARLSRGPMAPDEALDLARPLLGALAVLHDRSLVHRDLKPANIHLTPHGLKILDFGLARDVHTDETRLEHSITRAGTLMGTPRYMAPEQIRGHAVDARADVFSAATVIHEMLTGRPAFDGKTLVEILHAIGYESPAPLPPGLVPAAVEDVLQQALAKAPEDRYPRADAFLAALEQARAGLATARPAPRRATRLIVLPLRILRPDPETEFLAFSLPDAVAAALSSLDGVVIRSSLGATVSNGPPNLQALADDARVDAAVTGTLLRVGARVRVAAQLVGVPHGALLWSHTIDAPVEDLFRLQDVLTNGIVSSLQLPLSAHGRRNLEIHVPSSARAYELFLRANQLVTDPAGWREARALYEQAVQLDPSYAPAWARLGRVLRVLAKWGGDDAAADRAGAERAFQRALALEPDLAVAHHLYTHLEVETGRATEAMIRLIAQARRRPGDPSLFAGLVTTCRYAGLLEVSLEAHERARRLDPAAQSSVAYTHYLLGRYEDAIRTDTGDAYAAGLACARLGRREEAEAAFFRIEHASPHDTARLIARLYRLAIFGAVPDLEAALPQLDRTGFRDPEGLFLLASCLPRIGAVSHAAALLRQAVEGGFACAPAFEGDPWWDPLRSQPDVAYLSAAMGRAHRHAAEVFTDAGGPSIMATSP